ncbi:hypothetical protein BGX27_011207 [Mortierella sp. AM989]|nr:hypothetical protein BGX27_011207 [Mortierella sp. AM989]
MSLPTPHQESDDPLDTASLSPLYHTSKTHLSYLNPIFYPHPHIHIRLEPQPPQQLDSPSSFSASPRFSSPSPSNNQYQLNHDFANLCLSPLHSWSSTSLTTSNPNPMLLMCDPTVDRGLKLTARKLVQKQRKGHSTTSSTPIPSLFVILPGVNNLNIDESGSLDSTHYALEENFYLYFLCDYGGNLDDLQLRLHVCENGSSSTISTPSPNPKAGGATDTDKSSVETEHCIKRSHLQSGYRLRNLDTFLIDHTIPMLSLLRAIQDNPDMYSSGSRGLNSSSILERRIRAAIRFLATHAYEVLKDFKEYPSVGDLDLDGYGSTIPDLQWGDFWDEQEAMAACGATTEEATGLYSNKNSDGNEGDNDTSNDRCSLVLGGCVLCRSCDTNVSDGILWLCRAHSDVVCEAPTMEQLKFFVEMRNGNYIPMEKSCEVRFVAREDAQAFYKILSGCQHVIKLKISLAWHDKGGIGVTEEDLWQLCEVVHTLNLHELMLDCGSDSPGFPPKDGPKVDGVAMSFRPILGMLCRTGLTSLTVENFDGDIFPGQASIQVQGNLSSFSLQQFRESEPLIVPEDIPLKGFAFRHWARYPNTTGLTSVIASCPNLMRVETLTDSPGILFASIQNVAVNFGKLNYINMNMSPLDTAETTIWRLECGRPALRRVQRRSNKPITAFVQNFVGLEAWSVTECIRIWEHTEALHKVIHNNIESLESIEIACVTDHLLEVWPVLLHELTEAENVATAAAIARGDSTVTVRNNKHAVLLRLTDLMGHSFESLCSHRLNHTILAMKSYEDSFRSYLRPFNQFASTLSIDAEFTNAEQLKTLFEHMSADDLWFNELAWFLTPQTLNDSVFMSALQALVHRPDVETFTIRINGGDGTRRGGSPLEQIQTLLRAWNDLTGMSLGWVEYGLWMQGLSVQLEHPFSVTLRLPTGTGEMTFSSENVVIIGRLSMDVSAFTELTADTVGPIIYALSCSVYNH